MIVSLSLNLEFGFAGIPNFGKVLPVAAGAFVVGFLPGRLAAWMIGMKVLDYVRDNSRIVTEVNGVLRNNVLMALSLLFATLVAAAAVGAVLGFVASYPTRRLREDYLAMTLLAMGEAVRVIGYNYAPLVGGTLGVQAPDPFAYVTGPLRFTVATVAILCIAAVVFLYLESTVRSPLGRTLKALRDNEIAASSLGKDIVSLRLKVLMVGSALAAMGGALYAFYSSGVIASTYGRVDWTFLPWVIVMLGGAANNRGVSVGTLVFVSVRKFVIFYKGGLAPFLPFDVVWLDMLAMGIVLILILMYKPEGLLPEQPIYTIDRSRLESIAKSIRQYKLHDEGKDK
jgi:branched-chain amino acid transport system permease protein